ncbi:cupin domain-containing protein [Halioxenophilus sp. WMMB6]|uniref:cupin domain-containing protein n=1 Tax=Halioxenophilus sp. WMMB6 TaxID=3073815 RepID=UPI00295E45EE|nr:cupin domain-containing protein [Halioxenophilus sp. WMMB6]
MVNYIITRAEIAALPGLDKTHFLNDNAQRNNKSLGDLTGLTGFGFHLIEVAPGRESTEYHVHRFEDECTYILQGEAEVTIGEQSFAVGAGDFIAYPANGLPHTMRNCGTTTLRCIVVGERRAHDEVDYPLQGKRLFRNSPQPMNLVDISTIAYPSAGKKV